jgi:hypothetical protein
MNESNKPMGTRFWKPDYDTEPTTRLFCPLDTPTLAWLAERAQGRSLGVVAAEILRELAQAETFALREVEPQPPGLSVTLDL